MKHACLLLCLLISGCTSYTEAQIRLLEQARRGIALCKTAGDERAQIVEQFYQIQRIRLDEAFDADVRQAPALEADWVIEHRKAYAAARDALAAQRQASAQATVAARQNLEAVDAALQRALELEAIEASLFEIPLPQPSSKP